MSEKMPQRETSTVEDVDQAKCVNPAVDYKFSAEEEKQVLRKIDRVILPLMALVYFFQCESQYSTD